MRSRSGELNVHDDICAALEDIGIRTAFPIQALALPIALGGNDIIGQARTGTGKTLAFGIPLLQQLTGTSVSVPQALVIVPTRELAIQVAEDLRIAGARLGTRVLTVYGGRAYEPQIESLRTGVDVVVGTPGRLSTWPASVTSTCPACTRWCSTRRTGCSTSASCPTSSGSSSWSRASGRRCCSPPPCRPRSSPWPAAT